MIVLIQLTAIYRTSTAHMGLEHISFVRSFNKGANIFRQQWQTVLSCPGKA